MVVAYIMWKHNKSLRQAMKLVKKRRDIHPNSGFKYQLQVLDELLTLPLHDDRTDGMHPIDKINLRLSLLPSHIPSRISRLGVEHQGTF